ncbi:hypothetical protein [Pseudomonas cremoricolorata]|uniref:Uncharacterized protein n=1 Tax=Pseudomonas cremoricolorata TaxID=157783 RepID=A0A089WQC5_9PSED|nr:hypothetical protein [Pseudomonas cremoricolorata]AIR89369.1 hypothetical protein LK03_08810 [Pseudomonas cremoricolorata]
MTKTTLVMLALAVFAAVRLSYLSHGDAHPPPPATTHDTGTAISQNDSNYLCGVFGEWVYKFPKSIFGSWAQYVGDDPWSGKFLNAERGCFDQFTGLLAKMCAPNYLLANYFDADNSSCPVTLRLAAIVDLKYLDNMMSAKRINQLADVRDGYDEKLGLYYFDSKFVKVERVFWRPASKQYPVVLGSCSVETTVSVCEFITYSETLGVSIEVNFVVDYIGDWKLYLSSAEKHLAVYKYKKLDGEK